MGLAFLPYGLYHLLLQEPITVRYALPLVALVVWLAAAAFELAGRWRTAIAVPVVGATLLVAVPGGMATHAKRTPRSALSTMRRAGRGRIRRRHRSLTSGCAGRSRPPTRRRCGSSSRAGTYRWLGLVDYWRGGGTAPVWFFVYRVALTWR